MESVYLDTNVLLKIFFDEEAGVDIAQRIDSLVLEKKLVAIFSEWTINEVIAAIEKKLKKGKIDQKEAHHLVIRLADVLEDKFKNYSNYKMIPIDKEFLIKCRIFIKDFHIPNASDAIHGFAAFSYNCDYFLSADRELIEILRKSNGLNYVPVYFFDSNEMRKFFETACSPLKE